jgi:hypothetical protein
MLIFKVINFKINPINNIPMQIISKIEDKQHEY